jgi:RNA-binding protein YhbY
MAMADASSTSPQSGAHDGVILVLGATGNVGQHVLRQLKALAEEGGHKVLIRAGTRDPRSAAARRLAEETGAEMVRVELDDLESLQHACEGEAARSLKRLPYLVGSWNEKVSSRLLCILALPTGVSRVFLALPQHLTPAQMIQHQEHLASVLERCGRPLLVKLSSFGIDSYSVKHVRVSATLIPACTHGAVPDNDMLK